MVSDLTPGLDGSPTRVGADHVLGISSASSSLAQLTVRDAGRPRARPRHRLRRPVAAPRRARRRRSSRPTSTERALAMTRLNAALNEVSRRRPGGQPLRAGRAASEFDLVVTNPPFVVSPGTGELLVYRDSGLPGDEMVRRVVTGAPAHLAPGGIGAGPRELGARRGASRGRSGSASWLAPQDGGLRRVGGAARGGRPGAVRRAVAARRRARPAARLRPAVRRVGWLVRRPGHHRDRLRLGEPAPDRPRGAGRCGVEEWPYEVEQPLGPEVADWFRAYRAAGRPDRRRVLLARPGARGRTSGRRPSGRPAPRTPR